jgi:outer membrane biosynthesis protein TonB
MMSQASIPQAKNEISLGRAIGLSIAVHIAVVAGFIVHMVIYPSEPLRLDDAIRVDIVALPDKGPKLPTSVPVVETKIPPPSPPPPEPAPLPEVKPPEPAPAPAPIVKVAPKPESPKINLKKNKKAQDDALKRLEALEKIEHMTKSQSRPAPPPPLKGNQVSHGGSLSGVIRLEQQGYLQTIDGSVKAHWNLPGFLSNANLVARARLFIDAKGNVIKRTITQSSHNDIYDQRVLTAIDSATPLPAPPSSLVNILEVDGIELEFVPQ